MTSIGIYSKHSEEFFKIFKDLNIDNNAATYISTKLTEICILSSYYVFCMRTKEWTELDLMNITFLLVNYFEAPMRMQAGYAYIVESSLILLISLYLIFIVGY